MEKHYLASVGNLAIRLIPYWNCLLIAVGSLLLVGPFRQLGTLWGVAILELLSLCILLAYFWMVGVVLGLVATDRVGCDSAQQESCIVRCQSVLQMASRHRRVFGGCILACWIPVVLVGHYYQTLSNAAPSFFIAAAITVLHLRKMRKFRIFAWCAERPPHGGLLH